MKKTLIRTLLALAIGVGIVATFASADPIKGEKIIQRAIHADCKIPSTRVALQHSVDEWTSIVAAGQMETEVAKLCGSKTALKPFRAKYVKHVADFLEHYANDSGAIPA
jgi:hypothetical protein